MKHSKMFFLFSLAAVQAASAVVFEYEFTGKDADGYTTPYLSGDGWALTGREPWTDDDGVEHGSWTAVYTSEKPTSSDFVAFTPESVIVDGQYTFRGLLTPGSGAVDMEIRMEDENSVYTDQSLTIDVKYDESQGQTADMDGSAYRAITLRQYNKDGTMTIRNGTLNLTKSDAVGQNTLQIDLYSNSDRRSDSGQIFKKHFILDTEATMNTTENLLVRGMRADDVNYSTYHQAGTLLASDGTADTPYKNVNFTNVDVSFADTAVLTAKDLTFSGANVTLNPNAQLYVYRTYVGSGSNLTVAEGTDVKSGTLVVNEGGYAEINGTYRVERFSQFGDKYEDGTYKYAHVDDIVVNGGGLLRIGSSGKVMASVSEGGKDFYSDVNINNNAKMIIEDGGQIITSRHLRMAGNAQLVLNGSNSILLEEGGKSSDSLIWLWSGTQRIEFNADNAIKGFCFAPRTTPDATGTTVLTVVIGENCNLLDLGTLTATTDGFGGYLTDGCTLVFEGFKNDTVRITGLREGSIDSKTGVYSEDNLANIKAEGYEDGSFHLEFVNGVDGSDGYWLNAVAVPEPAEIAAALGALALGIAVLRHRK